MKGQLSKVSSLQPMNASSRVQLLNTGRSGDEREKRREKRENVAV